MREPKFKVSLLIISSLCLMGLVRTEDPQVISEATNVTVKQVIHNKPIVIHTQLDNYEQPTLKDYQECHENAKTCRTVCMGVADIEACENECPVCPELIKEEKIVAGLNDTRAVHIPLVNATNIIRLTNQIHNIIDNSRGNITFHNNNVLHLRQNVSRVGGQFGLGYNNTNQCCIILRPKRHCEMQKFSTASRCHRKRHRVCGPQCKARVMSAKVITECDHSNSMEYFEESAEENCHQTIKYVPYRSRKSNRSSNKCNYIPNWPFVACPHNQQQAASHNCSKCMRLTYGYILRHGIPLQCQSCFIPFSRPNYNDFYTYGSYPPPLWPSPMSPPIIDPPVVDSDYDLDGIEGWESEKSKCISPEGDITDDCPQIESSGGDELTYKDDFVDDYDYLNKGPVVRKRRQTFSRSKYSRRYRQ